MKKLKIHRPSECTCPNCCHDEADLRAARLARKRRLVGPERVFNVSPAYRQRRVLKERTDGRGWLLGRSRSRVRPASQVRRKIARPQWPKWLQLRQSVSAALARRAPAQRG